MSSTIEKERGIPPSPCLNSKFLASLRVRLVPIWYGRLLRIPRRTSKYFILVLNTKTRTQRQYLTTTDCSDHRRQVSTNSNALDSSGEPIACTTSLDQSCRRKYGEGGELEFESHSVNLSCNVILNDFISRLSILLHYLQTLEICGTLWLDWWCCTSFGVLFPSFFFQLQF